MSFPYRNILLSSGRVTIVVVVVITLGFLVSRFLGPGLGDYSEPIINGYEYWDTGGDGKFIYPNDPTRKGVAVNDRVDEYRVDGDLLIVARKPREHYMDGEVAKSNMLNLCELWIIDTKKHQILRQAEKDHYGTCQIAFFDKFLFLQTN